MIDFSRSISLPKPTKEKERERERKKKEKKKEKKHREEKNRPLNGRSNFVGGNTPVVGKRESRR